MNRTFVDTHDVIALISPKDRHHVRAVSLSETFEGRPLLTTAAVLLEIGNALARGYKREAIQVIHAFLDAGEVEVVPPTPDLFDRSFELYRSMHDKSWGLIDCISFVVMRDSGVTDASTFDRHFEQAGFRILMDDFQR
jgi:predicted nucleic acid-binding protein